MVHPMRKSDQVLFHLAMTAWITCALLVIFTAQAFASQPEAVYIENRDQLYEQIRSHGEARDPEFSFEFAPEMKINGYTEELDNFLHSGGLWTFKYEMNGNRLDVRKAVYLKNFAFCDSKPEVYEYVQSCAEEGIWAFFIFFPPETAEYMFANECYELDSQLVETRLRYPSRYNIIKEWNRAWFSAVSYLEKGKNTRPTVGQVRSVYQLAKEINAHTDNLERDFEILMTFDVTDEVKGHSAIHVKEPLYWDFLTNAGIYKAAVEVNRHFLVVNGAEYYSGKAIAWYYRNGKTDSLNEKQQKTLDAALGIIRATSGSETRRARKIHDALCKRISYDGSRESYDWFGAERTRFEDKDTAIGALLEGKADCDGYSDAFYLCASLSGMDVGYLYGGTREKADSSHLRNIICLDGKWRMVDVTWDDKEGKAPSDKYFDIGAAQAGNFIWDTRAELYPIH